MILSDNSCLNDNWAFIADVHGNSPALKAVLRDIDRRGIKTVYNLGDSLFGRWTLTALLSC